MIHLPDPPTLAQALAWARAQGLDSLDAQLLLLQAMDRAAHDRAWLLAHDTDTLPDNAHTTLQTLVSRRLQGEPVAYLTGYKEFYGLTLAVDARVLVPRPDTETLVDWALEVLTPSTSRTGPAEAQAPRVIDLGTGSGAIALALKHSQPALQMHAVDYSRNALAVAQANAQRLGLEVQFRQGSWLDGITLTFDTIVSNPPYIAAADPHLAALTHEPLQALASGADGLDDLRTIISQAQTRLTPGGWLLLEHGYDQAEAVRNLLSQAGYAQVQSRCDLAGIERCSGGQYPALTPY
ncbi:MAG: peptide chain release factor N(5)-glutamine methyltransferase [Rhodoferax sp.]|nr:peptide chain release factor N(5)-glutamine methyltransferase [Rhodoferax sp.]